MILERAMDGRYLSNSYVIGDRAGGVCVLIDGGTEPTQLYRTIERHRLTVTHLLVTHHHADHVIHLDDYRARFDVPVLAHPLEAARMPGAFQPIEGGGVLETGGLRIACLHTPGHTDGMLAFLVNGQECFTGDTLFAGSVGGVRAPGATTFEDLRSSVMDTLMGLDHAVVLNPGHIGHSTIGAEWETNPFVRMWRGLDPEGDEPCRVQGEPARLVLLGDDYDGGYKAWVRWPDGRDDLVPGSRVERG